MGLRIGIVGPGGMGTVHYHNYAEIDGAEVVGVVGTGAADQAKADEWGLPCFASIKDLVMAGEVDVVDICTPTFLHAQQSLEAIECGTDVICEKPAALHPDEAEAVFAAAQAAGVHVYVAHVLQFTPEVAALRDLVRSREYGAALDAYFVRLSTAPRWAAGGWLFDRSKSGQVPFDLHIHDLDVIVSLFGVPAGVSVTSSGRGGLDYQEHYRFSYDFGTLKVGAEAGWLNADIPFTAYWRVYFEQAMVVFADGKLTAYGVDTAPRAFDVTDEPKIATGINVPPTGMYLRELQHFCDCIEAGEPSPLVTEQQVLTVLRLLEQVNSA